MNIFKYKKEVEEKLNSMSTEEFKEVLDRAGVKYKEVEDS